MTRTIPNGPVRIDVTIVQRLIASQFPQWADLAIKPVRTDGHDNMTFQLGDAMSVRMPSRDEYAAHVAIEHQWLPKLGPRLPLSIPVPLGKGIPGQWYPWPWTVNKWIRGKNASIDGIADLAEFAKDLANFLNVLQSIDATNGPAPGQHNFFRGGDLSVYDSQVLECLDALQGVIDASVAASIWDDALEARIRQPPVWVHGDIAVENLLVAGGQLCAVIEFVQLAAGDPSCDVTIAWTLFSGRSREAFRDKLNVDEATWVRGRGWGLWKALLQLREHRLSNVEEAARAERVIRSIIADKST